MSFPSARLSGERKREAQNRRGGRLTGAPIFADCTTARPRPGARHPLAKRRGGPKVRPGSKESGGRKTRDRGRPMAGQGRKKWKEI